ncbi:MAG TPA: hypothetical protein ENH21_05680 [Chromatiales bacterium]|nr:hypothetical protein [Chromatiales bacterium]HEX22904.1 hypothetical protein [Chromatiales bacterium]
MKTPIVIIGAGEMGGVFARGLLRDGNPLFPLMRNGDMNAAARDIAAPEAVLVAVGEGDLQAVLKDMPAVWRERLKMPTVPASMCRCCVNCWRGFPADFFFRPRHFFIELFIVLNKVLHHGSGVAGYSRLCGLSHQHSGVGLLALQTRHQAAPG